MIEFDFNNEIISDDGKIHKCFNGFSNEEQFKNYLNSIYCNLFCAIIEDAKNEYGESEKFITFTIMYENLNTLDNEYEYLFDISNVSLWICKYDNSSEIVFKERLWDLY